ncbi:hypothetical protein RGK41_002960 [Citrobacter freundii]
MAWDMQVAWWAWQAAETSMAVQLANAESKCRELAAEVQAVRWACGQVYMKGYNHGHLNTVDGLEYASDTELVERGGETLADFTDPDHCGVAADAILAEVRASAIPDEATERDLFEEWVMEKICVSKTTLEGLRTDDGYRNSTLSGTDYNGMWSQWKAIRAAQLRQEAAQ